MMIASSRHTYIGIAMSIVIACLFVSNFTQAQSAAGATPLQFSDAAEAQRFHTLASELRCVMCQNQSLADSNALIAMDLRREVLDLMREGRSDAEIKQFLVERYGEFVLYRPRLQGINWLLWLSPLMFLAIGGIVLRGVLRSGNDKRLPDVDSATSTGDDNEQEW